MFSTSRLPGYGRLVVRIAVMKLLWQCGAQGESKGRDPGELGCPHVKTWPKGNPQIGSLIAWRPREWPSLNGQGRGRFGPRKTKGSPCQREEEGIIIWTLFDECYDS